MENGEHSGEHFVTESSDQRLRDHDIEPVRIEMKVDRFDEDLIRQVIMTNVRSP